MLIKTLRHILYPIALGYGAITKGRNVLFDKGILESKSYQTPIISLGNITVGGTGKTPHTEYLIKLLQDKYKIATLSRGYGRHTKGFKEATTTSNAYECGDEPCQIKQKFNDITVVVDENRREGVEILEEKYQPQVIIMDDAYQHRYVKPGYSILLIDYSRPLHKDVMLPTGNLREYKGGANRADIVIITKCPQNISTEQKEQIKRVTKLSADQAIFFSTFVYGNMKSVFNNNNQVPTLKGMTVLLVTGIAQPQALREHLEKNEARVEMLTYADHHNFSQKDADKITNTFNTLANKNKVIITTEKDAVRLRSELNFPSSVKNSMFYIPIEPHIIDDAHTFHQKIFNYVTKN